jgi:hypothetical protein
MDVEWSSEMTSKQNRLTGFLLPLACLLLLGGRAKADSVLWTLENVTLCSYNNASPWPQCVLDGGTVSGAFVLDYGAGNLWIGQPTDWDITVSAVGNGEGYGGSVGPVVGYTFTPEDSDGVMGGFPSWASLQSSPQYGLGLVPASSLSLNGGTVSLVPKGGWILYGYGVGGYDVNVTGGSLVGTPYNGGPLLGSVPEPGAATTTIYVLASLIFICRRRSLNAR